MTHDPPPPDETDVDIRPAKRARLDASPSNASSAPTHTPKISQPSKSDLDHDRELRAGITKYVSPGLGFSGVLKQRYTDFLVNEIGLDGVVVHLKSVGAGRGRSGDAERREKERREGEREREKVVAKEGEVKEDGMNGEGEVEKKEEGKKKEVEEDFKVEDKDLEILHGIFGESTTDEVIRLVRQVRKHPGKKAKDFKAVIAKPIADKEMRTQAHQTLRRVFPNMLESGMEPDQSIRIKARPPAQRGGKNKERGAGRDREKDTERLRGSLGWDERGGEYLHFTMYKENKDTMEVVGFLGSISGGGPKSYSFAGTKDRRACTAQRVCVKRQTAERMAGISKKLFNGALGDFEYKPHELRLGDLMGNEFTITLRDCHFENEEGVEGEKRVELAREIVSKAVRDFSEKGFINYYGLQRFGSFAASTDAVGVKLLQEDFKGAVDDLLSYSDVALAASTSTDENPAVLISQDDRLRAQALHIWKTKQDSNEALRILPKKLAAERNIIQHLGSRNSRTKVHDRLSDYKGALMTIPRNLRLMYVHAYQSLVWNLVAGKRWSLHGDKVIAGDLVLVSEHKDKSDQPAAPAPDTVDQDGEMIINPAGEDSAIKEEEQFERARPLTESEAASGEYTIWDVVLPQPGFDVEYPRNEIGEFYKEFMGSEKGGRLDPYNMRRQWREISLSGGYRKFLARPMQEVGFEVRGYRLEDEQFVETDLERIRKQKTNGTSKEGENEEKKGGEEMEGIVEDGEQKEELEKEKIAVVLKLQLASSQYATVALRELMKAGGVKAFQPQFMGGR